VLLAVDTRLFAGLHFAAYVDFGSRISSRKNDRQTRLQTRSRHGLHGSRSFGADFSSDFVSVENGGRQENSDESGMRILAFPARTHGPDVGASKLV
jgi:hypothetical protein